MSQAVFSASSRSSFRHVTRLRVRWSEVDMQNIVFNAHYLAWYDTAFSDYWRSLGLAYGDTRRRFGCDVYLKQATTEFHASAKLDDLVEVCLRCERIGNSSLLFTGAVFGGNQLLNSAELLYVYADPVQQRAMPVPEPLRDLYGAFESGVEMTHCRTGDWSTLSELARAVREPVFVQEQGFAPEEEYDGLDEAALHAVVSNRIGMALATARLLPTLELEEEGRPLRIGRIGRVAVLQPLRGTGAGQLVMQALQQSARMRGDSHIQLGAQLSAAGFYRRLGYQPFGPVYEECGVPHQDMRLAL